MAMSIPGLTWLLFRALHITDTQLLQLLQPLQGRFPNTQAEYNNLLIALRRMGRILENNPNNIAQSLRNNSYNSHSAYMMSSQPYNHDGWNTWHDTRGESHGTVWYGNQNDWQDTSGAWGAETAHLYYGEDSDAGTDSDTASSLGQTDYQAEWRSEVPADASQTYIAQHLFWAYQKAKGAWRQYMGKPVRKVRRFVRRYKGKGKGKGKGKTKGNLGAPSAGAYLQSLADDDIEAVFATKGKGKGKRSSGKGKGRKGNPKGPNGQTL